jgi:hypothetical protein
MADSFLQGDMKYIIGAYASAPSLKSNDKLLEAQFYNKLIKAIPQIHGLEIPFFGDDIHKFGSHFLLNILKPEWSNVLTCIPGVMMNLLKNPHFGLASNNNNGRVDAINMYKRANKNFHQIIDHFGDSSIIAVQIVSAPSVPIKGVSSSKESLMRSMDEILKLDWKDAKIVIEHADLCGPDLIFEKGFLDLESEIEVLSNLSSNHNVGIAINWARSAIEGKNVDKPLEHIKLALKCKLLSGLIFSGTSEGDANYGAWKDTHMPFAKSYNVENFEKNSLLTFENIANTLELLDLNNLDYLGIKLLSQSSNMDKRVGFNKDAIFVLENIISNL